MKFKEITLVNFMRYKGENTIRFSTDDKMNVTAILGNNTVGKTTIAQAFRWGLYGEVITTNYTTKEKTVLLNKEIIAEMGERGTGEVRVEITLSDKVDTGEREYKFVRRQSFKRPPTNPHSHDVVPVADAKLTVLISNNGVPQDKGAIDDKINDHRAGYVQSLINEFFPEKLSNYFCNGVQREHNKKLNNGLPILHKVPPKRDYGRYFCILAEKGGTSHGGLTEKLSPFFTPKNRR